MSSQEPIIRSSVCQMVEGLSQPNVDKLIWLYIFNWKYPESIIRNLSTLYPEEDNSDEANRFRKFLENNEITFLGGANTINFLVIDKNTRTSQVFAVKKNMGDLLTPEMMQKLAKDKLISPPRVQRKTNIGVSLSVKDYLPSGSFEKRYEKKKLTDRVRYQQCSEDIQKMIIGFKGLQRHGVLFPDAKVTNWMIGNDGNLIIADIKSLVTLEQIKKSKEEVNLLRTPGYVPPETYNLKPHMEINVENIHAYILGANLYNYLTGEEPPDKITPISFEKPIFKGIIGEQYKNLIVNLIKTKPTKRMSLDNAMRELKFINLLAQADETGKVDVKEMVKHKTQILDAFSRKDPEMSLDDVKIELKFINLLAKADVTGKVNVKEMVKHKTQILEAFSRKGDLEMSLDDVKFIILLEKASTMGEVNVKEMVTHKTEILEKFSEKLDSKNILKSIMKYINKLEGRLESNYYDYGQKGEKERNHWLGNKVDPKLFLDPKLFQDLKDTYQNSKGDYLKSEILNDFKKRIEKINDKDELAKLKSRLIKTPAYKVLEKRQGWFTRDGHTSSVKAFEKMFEEQENRITHNNVLK